MSEQKTVTESMRLDQFVASAFEISRSQAGKHIKAGSVNVNGTLIKKASMKLKEDDRVNLTIKKTQDQSTSPSMINAPEIPILYEDDSCLVVNKPAALTVHPSETTGGETTLIDILRSRHGDGLQLVHRLDKDTTGCLLISKNAKAHAALQKQFKDRSVKKIYLAIVAGTPDEKKATIDAPIGRSLVNRLKMSLFKTSTSRNAVTTYEVLSESDEASLLQCDIHTGRTHQIRVHLSSIGHPILGDEKYGTEKSQILSKQYDVDAPLLHAHELQFTSPEQSGTLEISAHIPQKMISVSQRVGLQL
jgi:23S rRNA pseudouridine1911/1915/1917 synthase